MITLEELKALRDKNQWSLDDGELVRVFLDVATAAYGGGAHKSDARKSTDDAGLLAALETFKAALPKATPPAPATSYTNAELTEIAEEMSKATGDAWTAERVRALLAGVEAFYAERVTGKSVLYDAFTSRRQNPNMPQVDPVVLKTAEAMRSATFDAFTSRRLNPGLPVASDVWKALGLERPGTNFYSRFTSERLNRR